MSRETRLRIGIVGATGYTGAELVRLLRGHPRAEIVALVGHSKAGEPVGAVLPSLRGLYPGAVESFDADALAARTDACFLALPHGASAEPAKALLARGVKVFDLSADFRLADLRAHERWYGPHHAPELAARAVYGLVELHREALKAADLVAVPGCYPTAANLALAPLVKAGLVDTRGIVVDAKSGVSGAGRALSAGTHFSETAEGVRAYKAGGAHRHTPEIEQELGRLAGGPVVVTFTPHLVPMTRGIQATAYAMRANDAVTAAACTDAARALYAGSPSVEVLEPGAHPDTLWVRGSNRAMVSYLVDERAGRVVAQSVIDNLVKGASGQAVQCMNVRFGFPEGLGIDGPALWP